MKKLRTLFVVLAAFLGSVAALAQQGAPLHYLSAATTNATLVFGKPTLLVSLVAVNTTSTIYYLKLYNKATQPVCGTDVPAWTIPVPPTPTSGTPPPIPLPGVNLQFGTGFGFCLTGGIADNDTTVAATGVAINFGVSGSL